jgi:hypothetical protein
MDLVLMSVSFSVGMVVGAGIPLGYGFYLMRKYQRIKKRLLNNKETGGFDPESVKLRLLKAGDIAQQQSDLRVLIDMPSKNALHSKHKNQLIRDIAVLEGEKIAILQTIVADGFDPTIATQNDRGEREEVPLSQYIQDANAILGKNFPGAVPDPKKGGKLTVIKGGKPDEGGTTN